MSTQTEPKPKTETEESMSTVTLGDVAFDPIQIQDVRLSVEGDCGK